MPSWRLIDHLFSFFVKAARNLSYAQAINEGTVQAMELCPEVVILGQLINHKPGVFGTTLGLAEKFGDQRVHDFPVSENLMTSTAIGLALNGMRPILVHHRLDFMIYSLDAVVNWLALWRFKSKGNSKLPVTIRGVVGRGWGQGPQHSKSLQGWFSHLPGLRVAIPATSYDAKGLLLESVLGEDPTIIIEARSLFSMVNHVPEAPYRVRFGHAAIRRKGRDVTLVAIGMMLPLALRAAEILEKESIEVEVIDPRTVSPLDEATICQSVGQTRRLVVADPAWKSAGVAAEVIAMVSEKLSDRFLSRPERITFPDSHTPMSAPCEKAFYPDEARMAQTIREMIKND